jgi:hypothetical protein
MIEIIPAEEREAAQNRSGASSRAIQFAIGPGKSAARGITDATTGVLLRGLVGAAGQG